MAFSPSHPLTSVFSRNRMFNESVVSLKSFTIVLWATAAADNDRYMDSMQNSLFILLYSLLMC